MPLIHNVFNAIVFPGICLLLPLMCKEPMKELLFLYRIYTDDFRLLTKWTLEPKRNVPRYL